ncbi:MAG: hypothetical protein JGK24_21045 [Microcoleus sp. PH2017_29_MFU_D_A]|jgi:hypothetical protein|uniref:hypothetical protein n=1 Tax=unclassified Microcoleus TaxID=2642155 RepID=UPI001D9976CB|nr:MULTISPECIES: hypothetical protein [unclassified Microcoleus]MCC3421551.1 hypothetical protein [Microcoleus sp. PH2017_07_MST_O_A]MCC3440218.1 hypothetical protein [Microcoleus sp. PH2017_03_ELD_O_A]MCC3470142.1 hypothetical protein [Microcoleus sp. PH2017_06_SFM_O_A]MCC3502542.1 hypothetical protein [Microcoleus sp. PH2017_19_SFW_U_A]MCC3513608.1 hypothetical protein [Microcoleus sp. PH2017_17_BER_D_A]
MDFRNGQDAHSTRNALFVEQAGKPVAKPPQEMHSLWNRPESLLLTMVKYLRFNGC